MLVIPTSCKNLGTSLDSFNIGENGTGVKPKRLRIITTLCAPIRTFLMYSYCSSGVASAAKPLPCAAS